MNAQRHDLIYLDPQAAFTITSLHAEKTILEQQIAAWLAQGLPCIYAKQVGDEAQVNLGLPLFYAEKKHRIGLSVKPSAVVKQQSLPKLIEMQDYFFVAHGINTMAAVSDFDIAVYGSFLFHYLSGQSGITPTSDLDLLINYQEWSLTTLRELIKILSNTLQRTIDGEIRFQGVGDIPINELLNLSATELLCKNRDGVALISRTELYEYYPLL
jgi:phosphoribosyl-dephospho-CoA transferase